MATQEEIKGLKEQWIYDPCWDIEDTEGFEEHRAELLAYRLEIEAEHKKHKEIEDALHLQGTMNKLSCNEDTAKYIIKLETRLTRIESKLDELWENSGKPWRQ